MLAALALLLLFLGAPRTPRSLRALWAPSPAEAQPAASTSRVGFDHAGHALAVQVADASARALDCASCHAIKNGALARHPDHAACYGACHGAAPTRQEPAAPPVGGDAAAALRARTCTACHAAAELAARRFAVAYPPYTVAPDWPATMSHQSHREVSCLRCHSVPPPPPQRAAPPPRPAAEPHRRCLGCHTGAAPSAGAAATAFAMERCERCHRPAPPRETAPTARITVSAAFSHQTHQRYLAALGKPTSAAPAPARSSTAAPVAGAPGKPTGTAPKPRPATAINEASCLRCHGALVGEPALLEAAPASTPRAVGAPPATPASPIPAASSAASASSLPSAATCATAACHDGRAAFAITERCTECHREAPATFYAVPRPTKRFVHRQHQELVDSVGCAGCHRVEGAAGAVRGAGHAACASCHAADFGSPAPQTCGACHSSTEPWRTLRADRLPWESTEFGARLDHAKHPQPCQRCHTLDTAARQLRPPRDHSSCSGAGCHQLSAGVPPRLTECAACHQAELVNDRAEQRLRFAWSVRRRFDHTRHRTGPTGAPAECQSCHLDVAGALSAMPAPPKRTCEPCHDGGKAFSVTGVDCNRCHGGAR